MSDLIERLRIVGGVCDEAADEIERLQRENEELRKELDQETKFYKDLERENEELREAVKELSPYYLELSTLKQQLAEAKKDAERYRWLRKNKYAPVSAGHEYNHDWQLRFVVRGIWSDVADPQVLDGMIDQAMREGE